MTLSCSSHTVVLNEVAYHPLTGVDMVSDKIPMVFDVLERSRHLWSVLWYGLAVAMSPFLQIRMGYRPSPAVLPVSGIPLLIRSVEHKVCTSGHHAG